MMQVKHLRKAIEGLDDETYLRFGLNTTAPRVERTGPVYMDGFHAMHAISVDGKTSCVMFTNGVSTTPMGDDWVYPHVPCMVNVDINEVLAAKQDPSDSGFKMKMHPIEV